MSRILYKVSYKNMIKEIATFLTITGTMYVYLSTMFNIVLITSPIGGSAMSFFMGGALFKIITDKD